MQGLRAAVLENPLARESEILHHEDPVAAPRLLQESGQCLFLACAARKDDHLYILLDAEKAVWVLGGDKMGVMSIRGKWAFREQRDAEQFIRKHGGALASYEAVMKAVFEDMYEILRPVCEECPARP